MIPIVLMLTDIRSQSYSKILIHSFDLAIGLWVIGTGKELVDTKTSCYASNKLEVN